MRATIGSTLPVFAVTMLLAGCGPTIYSLRVPLAADEQRVAAANASLITIDDQRPVAERKVHTGQLFKCQRFYGDETYVPSKVTYLQQLLAQRVTQNTTVVLKRFDTIEYCEQTAATAGAAAASGAAAGAGRPMAYIAQNVPGGDSVRVRVAGEINSKQFDITRGFDYSDIKWRFTEMPASNPKYRERMQATMAQIADEIVAALN